jgi:hypothetical protein
MLVTKELDTFLEVAKAVQAQENYCDNHGYTCGNEKRKQEPHSMRILGIYFSDVYYWPIKGANYERLVSLIFNCLVRFRILLNLYRIVYTIYSIGDVRVI